MGIAILALSVFSVMAQPSVPPIRPAHTIWFEEPAQHFFESSPMGNGRLGAMVFGDPSAEHVVLNESTMWSGSPQDADRAEAKDVLPELRRLLVAGENDKAQELLQREFVCAGKGSGYGNGKDVPFGCYQVFGFLDLAFEQRPYSHYRRLLDLSQGITSVTYEQDGATFTRQSFVSAPDKVVVMILSSTRPGTLSFRAKLSRPERAQASVEGQDLVLRGALSSGVPGKDGVRFAGHVRVKATGGTVSTEGSEISVKGADQVLLICSAGTSMFDSNFEASVKSALDRASKKTYGDLMARSIRDHAQFYKRSELTLPEGPSAFRPTPERLRSVAKGEVDPSLDALLYHFGRYLLIGSSRPDSPLPNNLQGLWAEELQTPWNGDFHIDINVQMNYWLAETTGLGDCAEPLVNFIPKLVPNGEKTAKAYYGARGWVAHVITNPWHFTSPGEGADWGSTCSGGGWLCEHLWEHYAFQPSLATLKKIYPTLKGASQFFLDMLIEEPKHRWLVTAPSNSPENGFLMNGKHVFTVMGPTIDMEICRELFSNTLQAARILKQDPELQAEIAAKLPRLAPFQIGPDGRLQEWLEPYVEAEPHHRHVSHLYGLHPSNQISLRKTPEIAAAARKSLEARGDDGTGWSLAWKTCFWARFHDGERAAKLLQMFKRPIRDASFNYTNGGGVYPNLFCGHPPFQIDGNLGIAAAIAEMLLQSQTGELEFLPALPKSWATHGSVTGLRGRGGKIVNISWKDGKITQKSVKAVRP